MSYKDCFDKERRDFLRIVKRAGISAGALQASAMIGGVMLARVAEAQTGPTKSISVFMPGGCTPSKFFPTGSTLPIQTQPLQSHYNAGRIALLRNATMMQGGHGVMFTRFNDPNPWGKQSFDVNLGKTIGANFPVKLLNLGTTPVTELSREGNAQVPAITSPRTALDILFSGGGGGGGGGSVPPRKSLVDAHYAAVNDLKTKLGQHEKIKLDSHFTAIREIEDAITTSNPPSGSCSAPPNTTVTGFDATAKLMSEIAVLALSCNLTASASIAFGTDEHLHFLDAVAKPRASHDSHHNQGNPNYAGFYDEDVAYYMSLTKQLIDKLEAKGLLSSTILTQVSDMGNVDAHSGQNTPFLVAGGGARGGVLDVSGLTQTALFQTVGLQLRANQGPNGAAFRNWGAATMAGLFV